MLKEQREILERSKRKRTITAIDPALESKSIKEKGNILELVSGKAENELKLIENDSVKVINADFLFNAINKRQREKIMAEVQRVLMKRGRLYLTIHQGDLPLISSLLEKNGFEITGKKLIEKVQGAKSPAIYANLLKSVRAQGTEFIPLRIAAVKKTKQQKNQK